VIKGLCAMFSRVVLALLTVAAALSAVDQAVVGQAAPHNVATFVADSLQSFGGRAFRLSQPSLGWEHDFGRPDYRRERGKAFSSMRTPRKLLQERIQYGALPYRRDNDARMEVMPVTSRETRRWIIPKGWPQKGQAPHRSAAREAYEEAGVVGRVRRQSLGSFSYEKRLPTGIVVCKVHVFALEVRRQSRTWPERQER